MIKETKKPKAVKRAKAMDDIEVGEQIRTRGMKKRRLDEEVFNRESIFTGRKSNLGLMIEDDTTECTGASVLRYEVVEKNDKKLLIPKRSSKRISKCQTTNLCDMSFDYKPAGFEGLF